MLGWIGLGRMGGAMCARLTAAGQKVTAWDLSPAAVAAAEEAGAVAADAPADLARDCEIVVLMLPDSRAVETVVADPDSVRDHMRAGSLLVDMSSSDPDSTRRLAATLRARSIGMVDAPVSRGVPAAHSGELSIFIGGNAEDVARIRPLLACLGTDLFHVGAVGSGHAAKALNNLLNATTLLSACEILLGAQRSGLNIDRFVEAVNASSGRSYATEVKFPRHILPRSFDSGFTTALMAKDVALGARILERLRVSAAVSATVDEGWQRAVQVLGGDEDHTRIIELLES